MAAFAVRADDRHALALKQAALLRQAVHEPRNYDLVFQYVKVCAALGDYEAAIGALERLLAYAPDLSRANFELAMLYYRMGSYDNAVHYFEVAKKESGLDPQLRARLGAYLPEAQKELQQIRWSGFLQTGLGYQSNVAALPDMGTVSLFGHDAPLGPRAPQRSDGQIFGLARITNIYDLENQRGDRVETSFIGYGAGEFSLGKLSLGYAEASIGPRLALDPVHWSGVTIKPYMVGNLSWIGGAPYLNSGGAGVSVGIAPRAAWTVAPDFEWRHVSVNDLSRLGRYQPTALGTGDYLTFSVAGSYKFTDMISVQVRPIYARASARNVWQSFNQGGFEAALHVEFEPPFRWMPLQWMVQPYVSALWDSFDVPNPAINPYLRRTDFAYYGGILLDMPITARLGLSGMVQYARTDSNLSEFTQDDVTVLFGPTMRF